MQIITELAPDDAPPADAIRAEVEGTDAGLSLGLGGLSGRLRGNPHVVGEVEPQPFHLLRNVFPGQRARRLNPLVRRGGKEHLDGDLALAPALSRLLAHD